MITHFRRLKVFNDCQSELSKIKKKKHADLLVESRISSRCKSSIYRPSVYLIAFVVSSFANDAWMLLERFLFEA